MFKAVLSACRANDPLRARSLLLSWARSVWPGQNNPGVTHLQELVDEPRLAEALQELEQTLYAGSSQTWSGKILAELLPQWRKNWLKASRQRQKNPLPPLYSS